MYNLTTNQSTTSFKSIHALGGGEQLLKSTLKKAERQELQKLIESQKANPVNITLAQHSDKRLCGWTVFEEEANGAYHRDDYTQRLLFDSPLKFIKRLCKKADKLHEKFDGDIRKCGLNGFELKL